MNNMVKVVSFDLEGTLVSLDYSHAVWHEDIPRLYAGKHGLSLDKARALIEAEYNRVGDTSTDWYDLKYWFGRFGLGDYQQVLHSTRPVPRYPDAEAVLTSLKKKYSLIIISSSTREFMPDLLRGIESYFDRIISSISDYGMLKLPELYGRVCREMGIRPEEMVHIGDSMRFDFVAASEVGIKAYYLDRNAAASENGTLRSLGELLYKLQGVDL